MFFISFRGAKQDWAGIPASVSLQAGAGGPVQANRTSIFFWRQVNVRWCREFQSSSKNNVCHVKNSWSCSNPNFGHLHRSC